MFEKIIYLLSILFGIFAGEQTIAKEIFNCRARINPFATRVFAIYPRHCVAQKQMCISVMFMSCVPGLLPFFYLLIQFRNCC